LARDPRQPLTFFSQGNKLKYGLTLRRGLILLAVVTLAALAYLIFAPLGLLWLYRTGGWDSWSKVLDGHVTDQGSAVFI
jgi:hypothetical protein